VICGTDDIFVLFFFEKIVFIPLIFYVAYMLYKLEETSKKITQGDMTATVDTKYFLGTFKKQGENLNSIKLGIASAVEDKMKSERFKTELITNVSHDIKTPLTSIINYVDLLNKEDLQNETDKEYIQIISKNSDRLKKLVVDLVDASKASSGVLKLDMQPMKIDVLLEQIAGEYVERLSENNLELIMRKPEESIEIMADGQRIYRVFDNLMNNICKYAQPNTRVYINLEATKEEVYITFRNTSKYPLNITSEELMERFVRGDESRHTEGSGLGLSIAQSLMELMRGKFDLFVDGDLFKVVLTFKRVNGEK
jgi:signal transduction histidine kinase